MLCVVYSTFPMNTLADILKLNPLEFDSHWREIDQIIFSLPTLPEQIAAWEAINNRMTGHPVSKGMPYFRLGHLHLLNDSDAKQAIEFLELAYREDVRFGPDVGKVPQRMGAYRLLALTKGFLQYLEERKNWEAEQLRPPHRQIIIRTLLAVYDKSLAHFLDLEGHTYQSFFRLMQDKNLTRFAIENYFCAENLLELFFTSGSHISRHTVEYPLARAVIGLFGGVLEAILTDKLPNLKGPTLGILVKEAHDAGTAKVGTKIAALSSMMLYLRNHIHPDRDISREAYFIDINVAKGCKVALDWVISDLSAAIELEQRTAPEPAANDPPAAVYKYLTADRATSILERLQIRFSQASILNDATELKPPFKGIATESDVKTLLTDRLRQIYPGLVERVESSLPPDVAARLIDDVMSRGAAQAEANLPANASKIYDSLDKNFGVLSLSETPSDSLLWGYYGDGGYGFLIEFDPRHKWFWAQKEAKDNFRHLRRVLYVFERPQKYLVDTDENDALYTKGVEWEHEKEWRIIRNFNDAVVKVGPDQYGKDVLLFAIPPECIRSIVIGYRAKSDSIEKIRGIVSRNSALAHVRFQKAVLSKGMITIHPMEEPNSQRASAADTNAD